MLIILSKKFFSTYMASKLCRKKYEKSQKILFLCQLCCSPTPKFDNIFFYLSFASSRHQNLLTIPPNHCQLIQEVDCQTPSSFPKQCHTSMIWMIMWKKSSLKVKQTCFPLCCLHMLENNFLFTKLLLASENFLTKHRM